MKNLSDLTIIIPSYNRQKYLLRQLEFWKNIEVKVLVLDGTEIACSKLSEYNSPDIKVIHIPETIEKRLGLAAQMIDTKYAAMISDDEFFIPSALDSIIQFLNKNLSYAACKGRAIGFNTDSKYQTLGQMAYEDLKDYDLNSESSTERLINHMSPYVMASLWAVHRSEVLITCLDFISRTRTYSTAAAVEVQISMITAWHGKIRVLNELMWLRSYENDNIWWSYGNLTVARWFRESKYKKEVHEFIKSIACLTGCDPKYIRLALKRNTIDAEKMLKKRPLIIRLASIFSRYIPSKLKLFLQKAIKKLILKKNSTISLLDCAYEMQNSHVIVDTDQLKLISKLIKDDILTNQ